MRDAQYGRIINLTLLIGTAIGILHPAFVDNKTFTQIVVSLFEPELLSQGFVMRWLLVLGFLGSLYVYMIRRIYRNVPITVISTKIDIRFLTADGSNAEIHRQQLLRANQSNVTAYYSKHTSHSAVGTMPKNRVHASIHCESCKLESTLHISGREGSSLEIIHLFNMPLPYSGFLPLVPVFFLNKEFERIPKFIRKYLAVRRAVNAYVNEYNVPDPVISFTSVKYPQSNVVITLHFQSDIPQDLVARRIKNNGVIDVPVERDQPEGQAHVRVSKMDSETVRITWTPQQTAIVSAAAPA